MPQEGDAAGADALKGWWQEEIRASPRMKVKM